MDVSDLPDHSGSLVVGCFMLVISGVLLALFAEELGSSDLLAVLGGLLCSVFGFLLLVVRNISSRRWQWLVSHPPANSCGCAAAQQMAQQMPFACAARWQIIHLELWVM